MIAPRHRARAAVTVTDAGGQGFEIVLGTAGS